MKSSPVVPLPVIKRNDSPANVWLQDSDNIKIISGHLHCFLEVDGVLTRHSSVLRLALDVDDLVLGQPQSSQHWVPDQETQPGLAPLLALPHPALLQLHQVHQVDVLQGGGRDVAALVASQGLLQHRWSTVAWGQPQHTREPRLGLHLQTVNL